jgi:hypothetical protein
MMSLSKFLSKGKWCSTFQLPCSITSFIISPLGALTITTVKFIMFYIYSNLFLEQPFTLECTCILLHMVGIESLWKKQKWLIEEKVSRTPKCKNICNFLNHEQMFLVKHMFNEKNDGIVNILKGNQLKQIHEKFIELNSSNVCNMVSMFKPHSDGSYINNILQLKSKSRDNYIQEYCFLGQNFRQKVFLFKMSIDCVGSRIGLTLECNVKDMSKILGLCLNMSNMSNVGQ